MTEFINRLEWERFVLNELPPERARILAERLARDPGLRREIEEIEQSNGADLNRYPAARVVPLIRERARREITLEQKTGGAIPRRRKRLALFIPALAAAAVLAVLVIPGLKNGLFPGAGPELVKGTGGLDLNQTQLLIYRKRGTDVEILAGGDRGRAGDLLQLAYVAAEPYGMILSLDGAGTISLHLPDADGPCASLEPKRKILLSQAVELDAAPRFERFFLVTSDALFETGAVRAAIAALAADADRAETGSLVLPPGLRQISFLVRK
jgi:hypothetical protein